MRGETRETTVGLSLALAASRGSGNVQNATDWHWPAWSKERRKDLVSFLRVSFLLGYSTMYSKPNDYGASHVAQARHLSQGIKWVMFPFSSVYLRIQPPYSYYVCTYSIGFIVPYFASARAQEDVSCGGCWSHEETSFSLWVLCRRHGYSHSTP